MPLGTEECTLTWEGHLEPWGIALPLSQKNAEVSRHSLGRTLPNSALNSFGLRSQSPHFAAKASPWGYSGRTGMFLLVLWCTTVTRLAAYEV